VVVANGGVSILSELTGDDRAGAWHCVNCWRCIELCPHGIDIYGLMMQRRRQEPAPPAIEGSIERICRSGCALVIRDLNVVRMMHGLDAVDIIEEKTVNLLLADPG
jgi:heterodisulfide reductase subunit C